MLIILNQSLNKMSDYSQKEVHNCLHQIYNVARYLWLDNEDWSTDFYQRRYTFSSVARENLGVVS